MSTFRSVLSTPPAQNSVLLIQQTDVGFNVNKYMYLRVCEV
eukprot:UN04750